MNKFNRICLCIIIGFSILGVLGSSIFFFIDIPQNITQIISAWLGIIGTVFSVILSIMAMYYSNKSSKDAELSLKKITDHYEILCRELAAQGIQQGFGKSSIERILSNNQLNPNKDD